MRRAKNREFPCLHVEVLGLRVMHHDRVGALLGNEHVVFAQGDPDVLREFRERFWYGRRAVVREVVDEARRCGEFRTDMDTELQMDILYAPIYFRLLMRHLPLDAKFADAHCAAIMNMLAAPQRELGAAGGRRRKAA